MKFSLYNGQPIAYYKDGNKAQIIHVNNDEEEDNELTTEEIADLIEEFIRTCKGRISMKHVEELQESLTNNEPPKDKKLLQMYESIIKGSKENNRIIVPNHSVMPTFDPTEERKIFYICGMSGCGKSTLTGNLIENYHKIFPKNKVFLFSNKPEDPALDRHKYVIRISLNDELVSDPLDLSELKNSLVIYDDVEYVKDKSVNNELDRLRDLIMQQGRSYKISFIYISHLLNNYKQSRIVLNECHCCVVFPQMTTTYSLKYLLEKYFGFSKNDVIKLKTLPSRWCAINKTPPCVVHEHGCYMIE